MELVNVAQFNENTKKQLTKITSNKMKPALDKVVETIILEELPTGMSSPIAKDLNVVQLSETEYAIVATSQVWSYLNFGTGIYSDKHKGRGPGGRIVPTNAKALHFKNAELADALGFDSEDVFLRSVRGIKPRFFFEKALMTSKFNDAFKGTLVASRRPTTRAGAVGKVIKAAKKAVKGIKRLVKRTKKGLTELKGAQSRTSTRLRTWRRPKSRLSRALRR